MAWNGRNPAVKRILQELREAQESDNPDVVAEALEEDIFEWHFAIRGAWGTDFAGGIYHGRILLPADFPFRPPSFVMLTPSGRFEVNSKICLSISSHHPESWQPSWNVLSALIALIAFMPTPAEGAVGSLEAPPEARRAHAAAARRAPPPVGDPARQEVVDRLHAALLQREEASRIAAGVCTAPQGPREAERAEGDAASRPESRDARPQAEAVATRTREAPNGDGAGDDGAARATRLGQEPPPSAARSTRLGQEPPPSAARSTRLGQEPPPSAARSTRLGQEPPPSAARSTRLGQEPPPSAARSTRLGQEPPPSAARSPRLGSPPASAPAPRDAASAEATMPSTSPHRATAAAEGAGEPRGSSRDPEPSGEAAQNDVPAGEVSTDPSAPVSQPSPFPHAGAVFASSGEQERCSPGRNEHRAAPEPADPAALPPARPEVAVGSAGTTPGATPGAASPRALGSPAAAPAPSFPLQPPTGRRAPTPPPPQETRAPTPAPSATATPFSPHSWEERSLGFLGLAMAVLLAAILLRRALSEPERVDPNYAFRRIPEFRL